MPEMSSVQVAVVGAGLAGLTAAYRLQQAGVDVALYEANPDRVGGRCWTERSFFAGRLVAEHGPERIDTGNREIRELADELGLELLDHWASQGSSLVREDHPAAWDEGEASSAEAVFRDAVRADLERRGIPVVHPRPAGPLSEAEAALDAMSVREWIEATLEGGLASSAGQAAGSFIAMGAGRSLDELSAFMLTRYVGAADDDNDVRYQVRGGNSRIPEEMRARLSPGVLTLGAKLTKITKRDDGYRLDFASGDSVAAQAVILALPFTTLRHVDLTDAGFSDSKRTAIQEFDLGTLTKIIMQFDVPITKFPDWDGVVFNLDPMFYAMNASGQQEGDSMIVTTFFGGADSRALSTGVAHAPAPEAIVTPVLDLLERVLPGLKDAFTGLAWMDSWCDDEFTYGAYSSYRPGQVARFGHAVATPEGGVFFAGEHTAIKDQAHMNGAVESGQRAAHEALDYVA
jgi:monoamine oxidase